MSDSKRNIPAKALKNLLDDELEQFYELSGKFMYEAEMSQEKADYKALSIIIDRRLDGNNGGEYGRSK